MALWGLRIGILIRARRAASALSPLLGASGRRCPPTPRRLLSLLQSLPGSSHCLQRWKPSVCVHRADLEVRAQQRTCVPVCAAVCACACPCACPLQPPLPGSLAPLSPSRGERVCGPAAGRLIPQDPWLQKAASLGLCSGPAGSSVSRRRGGRPRPVAAGDQGVGGTQPAHRQANRPVPGGGPVSGHRGVCLDPRHGGQMAALPLLAGPSLC